MTARPAAPETGRGKAARGAIIAAATDLFADKGLRATSITDIAAHAGVNRAMIAYYFGNKGGLYDAIIDSAVEEAAVHFADNTDAAFGKSYIDVKEGLHDFYGKFPYRSE